MVFQIDFMAETASGVTFRKSHELYPIVFEARGPVDENRTYSAVALLDGTRAIGTSREVLREAGPNGFVRFRITNLHVDTVGMHTIRVSVFESDEIGTGFEEILNVEARRFEIVD